LTATTFATIKTESLFQYLGDRGRLLGMKADARIRLWVWAKKRMKLKTIVLHMNCRNKIQQIVPKHRIEGK
jgi:hypothetical protein